MGKSRYTAEQMLAVGKMPDAGTPVADVCRECEISHQTYFGGKKRFAGTILTKSRRLKELDKENANLRRLVAEFTPYRHALQ